MQRIITVSLNRNAFQLEEMAHARLGTWLLEAASRLRDNPDRVEILADLEQAVADQCVRRMRNDQTVITLDELEPALADIGQVELPAEDSPATAAPAAAPASPPLQQVTEGAFLSGVCRGLAHHAGLDVTLVRVVALILLFFTGGGMILLYLALMLLIPYAPLGTGTGKVRKLPLKSREMVTWLKLKLSAVTS
jgi:phage shock protein PspC (stress-responsive transcriptional regulator)